jgi:hypothetical protein
MFLFYNNFVLGYDYGLIEIKQYHLSLTIFVFIWFWNVLYYISLEKTYI